MSSMPSTFANDAVAAIVMHVSRLLTGFVIAILLSASSALAGASEDCAAAAVNVYGQQDYAKALRLCRPLAEQGDAKAQYALGFMYTNGEGVLLRSFARCRHPSAEVTPGFGHGSNGGRPRTVRTGKKSGR